MIVDSSALTEQVVRDIVQSAFDSAGQRCSALRVLFVQEDVKEKTLETLIGYLETISLGDPLDWETDIGPVIDGNSQSEDVISRVATEAFHEKRPAKSHVQNLMPPADG